MITPAAQAPDHELSGAYQDARSVLLGLARTDINAFIEYVLTDEQTGKPVEQARTHLRMQSACDDHDRLILWSHVEAGKTVQIAVARVLFILGAFPGATVAIVSDTHEQAAKIVRLIAKYIENSDRYHEVFPHVRRGEPWTSHHLYLEPLPGRMSPKDPSVQACGLFGNITGSRISHMVWDDILDLENTRTAAFRTKVYEWLMSAECIGRLLEAAPLWCIGNAYHPDDALHRLSREPLWHFMRLPVEDDRGQPTWPERWSAARIARKRLEAGPLEFARQMMCTARDDAEARFKREDLDACCARGRGLSWVHTLADLLASPWPLPAGALAAMPAHDPRGRVSDAHEVLDGIEPSHGGETDPSLAPMVGASELGGPDDGAAVADAAARLSVSRAMAANRALQRAQDSGGVNGNRPKRGKGQAQALDPLRLFPDLAAKAVESQDVTSCNPWAFETSDSVPAWLAERQAKEREAETVVSDTFRGGKVGGPTSSDHAKAALGVLPPSDNAHSRPTFAHIVHTPQATRAVREVPDGHAANPGSMSVLTDTPADPGAQARENARDTLRRLLRGEATALPESALDHFGCGLAGAPPCPSGKACPALAKHGEGGRLSDGHTHGFESRGVGHAFKNMPGARPRSIVTRPHGAPAGVEVSLDSYGWLGQWLGDPGTPHRDENGWPVHPRSVAQLRRMGIETFTGVDLAVQKHSAADYTVLYTIALYPPNEHGHRARRVLEIQRGKWYALDICRRIIDTHDRFGSIVAVENVAAQDYLRQIIMDPSADNNFGRVDAPSWLFGYTTGGNKANPDFGVEHLAAELAREQWIFPVGAAWYPGINLDTTKGVEDVGRIISPELQQNFTEVLYFDPSEHTGDVLMAMWLAKEAARLNSKGLFTEIGVRTF